MKVHHFYHIYAAGAWAEPVREHASALSEAGFEGGLTVGLIGPAEDRDRAREMVTMRFPVAGTEWIEADEGFEQLTLTALKEFVQDCKDEYAILYAHTKGALDNSSLNACWRRSMTRHVVGNWRKCVSLLENDSYDTVGCHWLMPEEHDCITTPMYGGNFWWARSGYLRTLPPLSHDTRWRAEEWIGYGQPKAYDLLPGWPSMQLCAP